MFSLPVVQTRRLPHGSQLEGVQLFNIFNSSPFQISAAKDLTSPSVIVNVKFAYVAINSHKLNSNL